MAEILHQLRLLVYSMIYKVLAPSQVVQDFFHQQSEIIGINPYNPPKQNPIEFGPNHELGK